MSAAFEIPHTWDEPEGLLRLLNSVRVARPQANARRIRYAYFLAEQAHAGQVRHSGEPYITHPLAVAQIVSDLQMDEDAICAALMHDVLEDSELISRERLESVFGPDVLHLVDGVTKLKLRQAEALTDKQRQVAKSEQSAETFRKMLLAMAQDIRVMVIKLADRLHNMRTLDAMPPEKQIRIASETLDIYAPLAARLGIWQVKWQLEDLSFKYLHPKEFQEITDLVSKKREDRERELQSAIVLLKERLEERGILNAEVNGRPKHLYSIWNKIVKHGFKFEEILDLLAMRVILDDTPSCYMALGVVHDLWVPIMHLFYDYIAKPKPNGYQSLHTKVVGPHGEPLEIQIRTREMHQIAEYGVAAHWAYKEGATAPTTAAKNFDKLRNQLFDWSSDHRMSSDFLRSVSNDLFSEQVFVFTPKGDTLDLPKGSTPIDFAFRVHSNLGLMTVGAKINGQIVPLNTALENGDVVELMTRSNAQPSLDWLEFVKSAHARNKLRAYFRKRNKGENAARGRDALERELKSQGMEPREFLGEDRLDKVAKTTQNCETAQDVLAGIGEGLITAQSIVAKLRGLVPQAVEGPTFNLSKPRETSVMSVSGGIDNVVFRRAPCCEPVPGEDVVGFVSRGRGIVIHRAVCPNADSLRLTEPERLTEINWEPDGKVYTVHLKLVCVNRSGLLMEVTTIFAESKINIVEAKTRIVRNQMAELDLGAEVRDNQQLAFLINKIGNLTDVISILRASGKSKPKKP